MGPRKNYNGDVFEQLQEMYAKLEAQEQRMSELSEYSDRKINTLTEELADARKEIADLKEENQLLKDDNERLKRIINNDSNNSSNPPSTDNKSKRANTYNNRQPSEKKKGGQPGHKGHALTKEDISRKIKNGELREEVINIGNKSANPTLRPIEKYIIDIEVNTVAKKYCFYADESGKYNIPKEFQSDVIYGDKLKALTVDLYCEGIISNDRIMELINGITGNTLKLSAGSVYRFCKEFAAKSSSSIDSIREDIMNAEVAHTDASFISTNGKQTYIRTVGTERSVVYYYTPKKTIKELEQTGLINSFAGIFVHDHETSMYHFGTGHAECNVHILRYLRKNSEETSNNWSSRMSKFLCGLNDRQKVHVRDNTAFTDAEIAQIESEYDTIIRMGFEENSKTYGKLARSEELTLLNRLTKYKANHLLFTHNLNVPFSNNLSERDLRKTKGRQKMSGGFRSNEGASMYCSILSVVETCKRRNLDLLDSIETIFRTKATVF